MSHLGLQGECPFNEGELRTVEGTSVVYTRGTCVTVRLWGMLCEDAAVGRHQELTQDYQRPVVQTLSFLHS